MMNLMMENCPTEEEIKNRIVRQLNWRNTESVSLIWQGYLAALLEWGLIEVQVYDRLSILVRGVGEKEIHELFLDEPISAEYESEIGMGRSGETATSPEGQSEGNI
ncbi:hypothetical protein [Sphingomonas sp. ABOLE]|uniref:hypothetical protein n=1 Tax=Sphingomonas sp. ABOLE TaxID=1985878 RepID=UPI0019D1D3DF|nr:hypothetical protein [Sphingomonas sp. ABOLE]